MVEKKGNFIFFIDKGYESDGDKEDYYVAVKIDDIYAIEEINSDTCRIHVGKVEFKLESNIDELLKIVSKGHYR